MSTVVALIAGGCAAGAASAAMLVSRPVRLPETPSALFGNPDGSVVVVTGSIATGSKPTLETTVAATGVLGHSATLAPSMPVGYRDLPTAVTSIDAVAAYGPTGKRHHVVVVASLRRGARSVVTRPISTPGRIASRPRLVTGAAAQDGAESASTAASGSAVGVLFRERDPGGAAQMMWAVRLPGAAGFTAPVAIDDVDPQRRFSYTAAIGADGSGVVVRSPNLPAHPRTAGLPLQLRRLHAGGSPGPWAPIGGLRASLSEVALAASESGAVTIGMSLVVPDAAHPAGPTTSLFATTSLPAGADTPTPPQPLITGNVSDRYPIDSFSVTAGTGDAALVAVAPNQGRGSLRIFEGASGSFKEVAHFRHGEASSPHAVFTRDGGATVIWQSFRGLHPSTIMATHRTATGRYTRPQLVAKPRLPESDQYLDSEAEPGQLVALGNNASAFTYTDDGQSAYTDYLVTLQP